MDMGRDRDKVAEKIGIGSGNARRGRRSCLILVDCPSSFESWITSGLSALGRGFSSFNAVVLS